ncbi:UvrD-helicase domain-containing protein [Vibrio diabolicus]|uniref:UvrD-helicase domain-containing protein n=1 Tax=Vibrio diabolicus TaxID=50719 RepID=UPI00046E60A8|nr:ATP-dependent helicase [Vibrio parahaemolyticus]NVC49400.1 ATP-dependent helicase [Vibrio diabolicus]EHJ9958767.1 ATP-dependent helicase [Vibrio parahaemolyticus]EHK0038397.1 ATP-dependent helicase [Vibrio parahaemolyticus]EHR0799604.1 ATP-dependent helicase [Vibrio parahaemolyticus]
MISIDSWRPSDGLQLEPNAQIAATEQNQSLALTAGPGAGKTEMLAQRADFLLRTGVSRYPKRILAISFKVDASKNLRERVQRRCGTELGSRFDSYTFHAFAKRIIDRFRVVLTGDDALTTGYTIGETKIPHQQILFLDLVPLAIKILQSSEIARNAIRQTYSDVFLDEFQDCTNLQYELVKVAFLGTGARLTAVGDTKQKIMGWAGALEGIFLQFSRDFGARPLNMYRNFRSQPVLLRLQNEIIRTLDPVSVMPDAQLAGHEGEMHSLSFDTCSNEAEWIADTVLQWIRDERLPTSEIAILVSKQLDLYAAPLMAAFEARGIPYRNEQQMQDITTEPLARLIVDYLQCLYGERCPDAWRSLSKLLTPFEDEDAQSSVKQSFGQFIRQQRREIVQENAEGDRYYSWWEGVRNFLTFVGLEVVTSLSPDYESKVRLNEVVAETHARINELREIEEDLLGALSRFSDDQAVRILTIHKSKGLEFDSVIMMAIENEIFFGDQGANRCAFFVGVSRAKRRLVLTHSEVRQRPDGYTGRWSERRTPQKEYLGYTR